MRTRMIGMLIAAGLAFTAVHSTQAAAYADPGNPGQPYKAANCTLVNTRAEADSTHVYTLNPTHVVTLNGWYVMDWGRNARCDELQFHVDHNTSVSKLHTWLMDVATGWYRNIGTSHFKGHTISTSSHKWYFVDADGAHLIPDWLTALSWGLLIEDRISIPYHHTTAFNTTADFADPLHFNDGPNATKIRAIWKNGDTDFSSLASRLQDEIEYFTTGGYLNRYPTDSGKSIFADCRYYPGSPGDPYGALLDWNWTTRNPGCPA